MSVRVQIAGVSSMEEALATERAGADALGFTLRLPTGPHDGLTEERARHIIAALPPLVSTVAISYLASAREALELCECLGVSALQLHGAFPEQELGMVRARLPHLKIIRCVSVTGPEAVPEARALARRADALILDTVDRETGRRGATGKTHDWNISRAVVDAVDVPVMLAGGLTPENVADAIRVVRPWAVDVHTGVENADGSRNLAKVRDFVVRAKSA